jgi:hypothetical protein
MTQSLFDKKDAEIKNEEFEIENEMVQAQLEGQTQDSR